MSATPLLIPLHGHYGLIRASGGDARAFLHGQLTRNLAEFTAADAGLAAWCNAKGRVLALLRVFMHGDDFCLRLPAAQLPAILQRLRLFVLRSAVHLTDLSQDWDRFGLAGAGAESLLASALDLALPARPDQAVQTRGLCLLRLPGPGPRFELHGETAAVAQLRQRLEPFCQLADGSAWRRLDIAAGLPEVYPETREQFVPQMLNLHWLDAVDFRKGCYPGQEIVARTQYLGQLKRRLFRARLDATVAPAPGTTLEAPTAEVLPGSVVDAVMDGDGCQALVILPVGAPAGTVWRLAAAGGGTLSQLLPLPYATPEEIRR